MQSKKRWMPQFDYFNGVSGKRIEDAIAYCKEAHEEDESARRYLEEQYNADGVLLFRGVTCFVYPSRCSRSDMRLVGTTVDGQVMDAKGHMENVQSFIFMPKAGSAAWWDITRTLAPALFFNESNYLCVKFADKGMDAYVLSPDNKTAFRSLARVVSIAEYRAPNGPVSGAKNESIIQFRVPQSITRVTSNIIADKTVGAFCMSYDSWSQACESDDEDCVIRRA